MDGLEPQIYSGGWKGMNGWFMGDMRAAALRKRGIDPAVHKGAYAIVGVLGFFEDTVPDAMRRIYSEARVHQMPASRSLQMPGGRQQQQGSSSATAVPSSMPIAPQGTAAAASSSPQQPGTPPQISTFSTFAELVRAAYESLIMQPDAALKQWSCLPMKDACDKVQSLALFIPQDSKQPKLGIPICQVSVALSRTWHVQLNGSAIEADVLPSCPEVISTQQDLSHVLRAVQGLRVCGGISSPEKYSDFIISRSSGFGQSKTGERVAYATSNDADIVTEVRHVECSQICSGASPSCQACQGYAHSLASSACRWRNGGHAKQQDSTSNCKRGLMDSATIQKRMEDTCRRKDAAVKRETRAKEKTENHPLSYLPRQQADDLEKLVKRMVDVGERPAVDGHASSHLAMLLQSQLERCNRKDSVSLPWNPLIIKWALQVHTKSPAAYEVMRNSGFLQLPHSRTLQRYINVVKHHSGDACKHFIHICNRIQGDLSRGMKLSTYQTGAPSSSAVESRRMADRQGIMSSIELPWNDHPAKFGQELLIVQALIVM